MNPLILLFKTYYSSLFLFGYGVEGVFFFISQADISIYSGSCIHVYSIQRYIERGFVFEMFLEVSGSFHMAMFYL